MFHPLAAAAELDEDQWELEGREGGHRLSLGAASWPSFLYLMNTAANIGTDPHAVGLRASLQE